MIRDTLEQPESRHEAAEVDILRVDIDQGKATEVDSQEQADIVQDMPVMVGIIQDSQLLEDILGQEDTQDKQLEPD